MIISLNVLSVREINPPASSKFELIPTPAVRASESGLINEWTLNPVKSQFFTKALPPLALIIFTSLSSSFPVPMILNLMPSIVTLPLL